MNYLSDFHCIFRYVVLLLMIGNLAYILAARFGDGTYTANHKKLFNFACISMEIMLLTGVILYIGTAKWTGFQMMDNTVMRFYALEHPFSMILATALMRIGFVKVKKAAEDAAKIKKTILFNSIALVIVLLSIPYAFRGLV